MSSDTAPAGAPQKDTAAAAAAFAGPDEWYKAYEEQAGYYLDINTGWTISISYADGGISSIADEGGILVNHYDSAFTKGQDGKYVYSSLDYPGDEYMELRYDQTDGSLTTMDAVYWPMMGHGDEYAVPADFNEKWFQADGIYERSYSGSFGALIVSGYADDTIDVETSDYVYIGFCSFDTTKYEGAACGGVYYRNDNGQELYYYPDLQLILFVDNSGSCLACKEDSSFTEELIAYEPEETVTGHYIMEDVQGNDIGVHVFAPYWNAGSDFMGDYYSVRVLCKITNTSANNITFNAADHFSLNNNGIIGSGSSEYDYTTIAPGTTIQTFIVFTYRINSINISYDLMTMTVDGVDVSLSPRPQSGEEYDAFPGAYCYDNHGDYFSYYCIWLYIADIGGGQYDVFKTTTFKNIAVNNSIDWGHVTLNADNSFTFGSMTYYWDPEAHTISYTSQTAREPTVCTKQ